MSSGIYTITNVINNKIYVGYAINFKRRWAQHLSEFKTNKHSNSYLKKAFDKYGINSFKFEILVECGIEFLASEEHYWSTILKTHNRDYGYNLRPTHPYDKPSVRKESRKHSIVIQYDIMGNQLERFESILIASLKTKVNGTRISSCCKKHKNRITAGGFIWRYEGDDLDLPRKVYKKFSKENVEDIRKLHSKKVSFKDIAEKYQVDDSYIHSIIKNKRHKV